MAFLACQCLEQGLALALQKGQIRGLADGASGVGQHEPCMAGQDLPPVVVARKRPAAR